MSRFIALLSALLLLLTGCNHGSDPAEHTAPGEEPVVNRFYGTAVTYRVEAGVPQFDISKNDFAGLTRADFDWGLWHNEPVCITNFEEFEQRKNAVELIAYPQGTGAAGEAAFQKEYDQEFFKSHALIPLYFHLASCSTTVEVQKVTKENGKLIVWVAFIVPPQGQGGDDAISTLVRCVELPKEEVVDCTAFELNIYEVWEM
jgi:hypothetical protein